LLDGTSTPLSHPAEAEDAAKLHQPDRERAGQGVGINEPICDRCPDLGSVSH